MVTENAATYPARQVVLLVLLVIIMVVWSYWVLCRVTREISIPRGNVAGLSFPFCTLGPTDSEGAAELLEAGSGAGLHPLPRCVSPLSLGCSWSSALRTCCWGWRRLKMMGTWRLSCWPSLGKQGPQARSQHPRGRVSLEHLMLGPGGLCRGWGAGQIIRSF